LCLLSTEGTEFPLTLPLGGERVSMWQKSIPIISLWAANSPALLFPFHFYKEMSSLSTILYSSYRKGSINAWFFPNVPVFEIISSSPIVPTKENQLGFILKYNIIMNSWI
jgi:hypothetical protein